MREWEARLGGGSERSRRELEGQGRKRKAGWGGGIGGWISGGMGKGGGRWPWCACCRGCSSFVGLYVPRIHCPTSHVHLC